MQPGREGETYTAAARADCAGFRATLLARYEGAALETSADDATALTRHFVSCTECARMHDDIQFLRRCCLVHPMLGEYAAWQLSPAAGDAVRSHLDGCGFCRAQAASLTPRTAVMPPPPTKPAPAARAMGPVSPPPVRAPVPARRWFPLVAGGVVCSGLAAGILWAATGSASHPLRSPASPSVSPAPSRAPLSGAASAAPALTPSAEPAGSSTPSTAPAAPLSAPSQAAAAGEPTLRPSPPSAPASSPTAAPSPSPSTSPTPAPTSVLPPLPTPPPHP
ncbi:MAG: hypothetical protein E6J14_07050 [Chloroflexi bacterium]|nr:MAG: hypothetical protein E6J14_07050 [Chloroflexota bacterium]